METKIEEHVNAKTILGTGFDCLVVLFEMFYVLSGPTGCDVHISLITCDSLTV